VLQLTAELKRGAFHLQVDSRLSDPVTGIIGASGSGKTTLLHMVAGLVRPATGRIVLDDEVLFDSELGISVPPHRRRLGSVFQDCRLFPHLSVAENLSYGERLLPPRERRFSPKAIIELLELDSVLHHRPGQLSGGQAQRVAVGRALLASPRMLLLDEPLASLDWRLKQQIMPFLRRVRDVTRIPMLYVSHDSKEILDLTDRVVILESGKVVGAGPVINIIQDPRVLRQLRLQGLVNILPLTILSHDRVGGLTRLQMRSPMDGANCGPAQVSGPILDTLAGREIHAMLRPEDIALAASNLQGISIQNQVQGRVVRLIHTPDRDMCVVDIGIPVVVETSPNATKALGLAAGSPVWCLFKSSALQYLGSSALHSPRAHLRARGE
jgi:molybdate transport system ATP-binding protein